MEVSLCRCGWDIPGVDELPLHWHVYGNEERPSGRFFEQGPFKGQPIMQMVPDPYRIGIVVDWKALAHA